jgi:hypothetical protein
VNGATYLCAFNRYTINLFQAPQASRYFLLHDVDLPNSEKGGEEITLPN